MSVYCRCLKWCRSRGKPSPNSPVPSMQQVFKWASTGNRRPSLLDLLYLHAWHVLVLTFSSTERIVHRHMFQLLLTIITQAHDWFIPHWCVTDWRMRSSLEPGKPFPRRSSDAGASHARVAHLQFGKRIFLQPFEVKKRHLQSAPLHGLIIYLPRKDTQSLCWAVFALGRDTGQLTLPWCRLKMGFVRLE